MISNDQQEEEKEETSVVTYQAAFESLYGLET